ncbi:amino acid adenylation domain-containing protein [Crenobacter sp. SG2303]|uniref:Amino acid adenylation domain-containing protein n=1 Tax=Crenobacter oryzisoli TaxID=3056844 RepID=A0ABT7XPK0_9NEIS|nr:Pls/PosA family non-ribosomal peptide synthetase [Crenobacter sp. SG2303]MDN0075724.1 amino acid adenylation domain-containing protein [Crenobacter sp. SG2303]
MILRGPHRPELLRHEVLPDLLEATAARLPGKAALIDSERVLSYGELDRLADLAAHHLIEAGVAPGQIVGLWLPRGADLLIMQVAITKAGAAWLPFDADTPVDRIAVCLDDAGASGLVCCDALLSALEGFPLPLWRAEALLTRVDGPLSRREGLEPKHPAYVIYTSGSTGKPKGIAIEHGSICHFLRSENAILGVREDDKVYQGFSVAFDMSFEEIWISYLVGATLWLAPRDIVSDPDALPAALIREAITVLHAVPTLLALFATDVPNLRIVNLGGEMCPEALVERWATPGRQMFNTYGPTEATVSASLAELKRGEPVTIGTPLPNYGLLVVDDRLNALPAGETGELCIIGPGVAAGYLGRPELTAEKFVPNPYAVNEHELRLYKTGDLARIDEHGQIWCLGRADDQVKVRGFRVELGEIEAALCELDGIGTAAVVLKPMAGVDQLVAYLAPEGGAAIEPAALRASLKDRLPPYMVPAVFEPVEVLPRLTSGKIDRKALRARPLADVAPAAESDTPVSAAEVALFNAAVPLFPGQALRLSADFFSDLGGHSLLAARLVSTLRRDARFAAITVHDVYQRRSLAAIAAAMDERRIDDAPTSAEPVIATTSRLKRFACGAVQALCLPPLIGLRMLTWLAPFFTYHYFTGDDGDSLALAVLVSLAAFLAAQLASFAIAIVGKWLVLGRAKPGRYPLWGGYYLRWWLADRLSEIPPVYLIAGSPLHATYLRLMGAKIGRDALIGSISLRVPDLLTVGDGASIGASVNLENARVERGHLLLGSIDISDDAYVGSYATLESGTVIEPRGRLEGLSALGSGQRVPAGQVWDGAPARWQPERVPESYPSRRQPGLFGRLAATLAYLAGAALVSALFFMPVFPSFMLIDWVDANWLDLSSQGAPGFSAFAVYLLLALPASALLVVATMLTAAALRWLVLPRLAAGQWPVHSRVYYRKWITNQIQEASLHVLHGLYASVFAPWWYRLLGARVGKGAEISTAMGVVPDMLTLGDDTFIADAVMLGDEEIDAGWMRLRPTVVGHRSFVGNGAYIPDGTTLPEDVLIGVQSKAPAALSSGDTWVGSPPMKLPAREQLAGFPEHLTFRPSAGRRIARGTIETLRTVLPLALVIAVGYWTVLAVLPIAARGDWVEAVTLLASTGLWYGVGSLLLVVALKWSLIGRYTPHAAPMWTRFVWLSEAITSVYESMAIPNCLNFLRGTPLLSYALRLFGVKIGRGVYLDTADVTEFDCVRIGDYSVFNAWSGPQTHLFEDRVMKIGRVEVGAGVTVGVRATVLYDASIGDGATLGPLTLVMKGEHIPAASLWTGTPAVPWLR